MDGRWASREREGGKEEGREREGIHIWESSPSSGLKALNWRREW